MTSITMTRDIRYDVTKTNQARISITMARDI